MPLASQIASADIDCTSPRRDEGASFISLAHVQWGRGPGIVSLKKSLWERRVRVPKAQGSRCGVWGGGSAPSQEKFFDFGS